MKKDQHIVLGVKRSNVKLPATFWLHIIPDRISFSLLITDYFLLCKKIKDEDWKTLRTSKNKKVIGQGPHHLNGCPLRRVNQMYVIATKTKIDLGDIKLPEKLNDKYFKKKDFGKRLKKSKKSNYTEPIKKVQLYTRSELVIDRRKEDQVRVDKQVLEAIRRNPEKKSLFGYLGAMFSLRNGQYPHNMVF